MIECEDGRLLHVRVGILERAMQRRKRRFVAANRNRRRRRGAYAPVVVGHGEHQVIEDVVARNLSEREHRRATDLDVRFVHAWEENVFHILIA